MLDPKVQSLLDSLRRRIRRYVVWDSLLAMTAIVLIAFWVGLLIDYLPVTLGGDEMPRSARSILLAGVGLTVLLVMTRMLLSRLMRPLPDDSLALLVERHHKSLRGRLITAVQLSQPGRSCDAHSNDLLGLVREEAAAEIDRVDPGRVFRSEPLIHKSLVVVPLLLLMLAFAVYSPSAFARAAGRLTLFSDAKWPRRANLEMVGIDLPVISAAASASEDLDRIEFDNGTVRLPVGSNPTLRIRANTADFEVPSVCTLYYQTDSGTRGQSNFRRVGRERDGFQSFVLDGPPLSNLGESFTFSILGLDDRLSDFRVEAVTPPAITEMKVRVRYPDYLRQSSSTGGEGDFDFETDYQAGLRISEGSDVVFEGTTSVPIGEANASLEFQGQEHSADSIEVAADGLSFKLKLNDFRDPTAVRVVPVDSEGISAQAPFRYFVGAIVDEPPSIDLSLQGIQTAVTPIALLPIECIVKDDYGIFSINTLVASSDPGTQPDSEGTDNEGAIQPERQPLTVAMNPDRDGKANIEVDLRELTNSQTIPALQPGGSISVYAEAKDGFNLEGEHLTTSEIFRLQVVTPEELLTLLERRELGLRTRLEQTVTETQGLRDQLAKFKADGFEVAESSDNEDEPTEDSDSNSTNSEQSRNRAIQILRLRVQQSSLQASKTAQEIVGIAESLDDLLQEMVNNRIDSKDRQERLGSGVRDPLRAVVDGSMKDLIATINAIELTVEDPQSATDNTEKSIAVADEVLLELTAVLEKMLDLESYNELLDLVRGLIQDQEALQEETKKERKNAIKSLFD